MNKAELYRESTAHAIRAMMEAACKDEYTDKKIVIKFPQKKRKREITLKDVREWNEKYTYKEKTRFVVDAMMESAMNDPYADKNPPSRF